VSHVYAAPGSYQVRTSGRGSDAIIIHVLPPPVIASFSASPAAVYRGEPTQLRIGEVTGYGKLALSIDQGVGPVAAYCPVIRIDKTTTFTLTASSPYGTTTATCTVTVKPAPEITRLTASPVSINRGDAVTLSWGTTGDGVSLSLDHGIGLVQGRRLTVLPDRTTTYTLTATNPSGEVSSTSATILVNQPPVPGPIALPALPAGQALRTVLPQAQDPEHDAIRAYSTLGLPAGLSFDPASRTLSGSVAAPGAYRFLYCAKDARGALGSVWVNLVIRAAGATPGAGSPLKVSYTYDGQGRLATLTYPSGRVVAYGYDALDRVTRISQNGQTVIQDIAYDAWGNRSRLLSRSGTVDQWACDASGSRVQEWDLGLVGSTPQVRTYAYDGAGRLTRAGEWDSLAYDPNGRLLRAAGFGLANVLAHDAYGNNTSSVTTSPVQVPVAFNNFTFDPLADNHLPGRSANGGLTRIDENNFGELTHLGTGISSEGALALAWDDLGRLASAGHEAYRYAASGLRAARTDSQDARQNRIYAYTTAGQCTAPSCLDQTLASGRLLGKPGFTGFLRCAPA
jgi:YD repeat-containing protein